MKIASVVTFISMIFATGLAYASVQSEGTFIPSQCGLVQQSINPVVKAVCIGRIEGEEGRAVQFRLNDQTATTFKVVNQSNMMVALLSGNTKSNFFLQSVNGQAITMKAILTHQGTVEAVSGVYGGADYFVPKMEIVFTIQ